MSRIKTKITKIEHKCGNRLWTSSSWTVWEDESENGVTLSLEFDEHYCGIGHDASCYDDTHELDIKFCPWCGYAPKNIDS
jgi:hypothetical protein